MKRWVRSEQGRGGQKGEGAVWAEGNMDAPVVVYCLLIQPSNSFSW